MNRLENIYTIIEQDHHQGSFLQESIQEIVRYT